VFVEIISPQEDGVTWPDRRMAMTTGRHRPFGGNITTLNINGHNMSVEEANDTPLLWAIREQLQMTGTKFG
jgi:hypothetical protein